MRIIKPYGRSHVAEVTDANSPPRRMLRQNESPETSREIGDFAQTHDALVIAQWISILDKIATKAKKERAPTAVQKHLRTVLGDVDVGSSFGTEPVAHGH